MREFINIVEGFSGNGLEQLSPEFAAWLKRWVWSSENIEDQIAEFRHISNEAATYLRPNYPVIYRGMAISDEATEQLAVGKSVTVPAHRLQSWTLSRDIANDYALPGEGGDVGVLIRKKNAPVVLDVEMILKKIGRNALGTDAAREREVIVETPGVLVIHPKDVLKFF